MNEHELARAFVGRLRPATVRIQLTFWTCKHPLAIVHHAFFADAKTWFMNANMHQLLYIFPAPLPDKSFPMISNLFFIAKNTDPFLRSRITV